MLITLLTTFNLAHWLFAFSYLVLSYQIELTLKQLPVETYNSRLNAINIVVCLLNVTIPTICWVSNMREKYKVTNLAFYVDQLLLVPSCIALIWGILRMARLLGDSSNMLVNKVMIVSHTVAYLSIIVANIVECAC
jgi:hypothetical protein